MLVLLLLLLLVGGGAGAFFLLGNDDPVASTSPTPLPTPDPTIAPPSPSALPSEAPASTDASAQPTPTLEPTPEPGDVFAFYEVAVGPFEYRIFDLTASGEIGSTRLTSFANYSFAGAEPTEGADGDVFWVTIDGDLAGWSYRWPDSGNFRVRAVFTNSAGERRSEYLAQDELTEIPEATPAP